MSEHEVRSVEWERERAVKRQHDRVAAQKLRGRAMRILERRWNASAEELDAAITERYPKLEAGSEERAELLVHVLVLQRTERPIVTVDPSTLKPPAAEFRLGGEWNPDPVPRSMATADRPKTTPKPRKPMIERIPVPAPAHVVGEPPRVGHLAAADPVLRQRLLDLAVEHRHLHPVRPERFGLVQRVAEATGLKITYFQARTLLDAAERLEKGDATPPARRGRPPKQRQPEEAAPAQVAVTTPSEFLAAPDESGGWSGWLPADRSARPRLQLAVHHARLYPGKGSRHRVVIRGLTRSEISQVEALIDGFLLAREESARV